MLIVRFGVKCFLPEPSSQCPSFFLILNLQAALELTV